jgi:hypothetical protein
MHRAPEPFGARTKEGEMPRFIVVALALATLLGAVPASRAQSRPASPGGLRVVENGEWLFQRDYLTATATITVAGDVQVEKLTRGVRLTVRWTEANHTWVDAEIVVPRRHDR